MSGQQPPPMEQDALLLTECPSCGTGVEAWNDDHCMACGFPTAATQRTRSGSLRLPGREFAGVLAVTVAVFAGMAMTRTDFVTTTASGAIMVNGFDAAFGWALGLQFLSMLLMMYVILGGAD